MAVGDNPAGRPARAGGHRVAVLIIGFETAIYGVAFLLLMSAAVLVVAGSVGAILQSVMHRDAALDNGIVVLDRVLLVLIIAEVAYTLRTVLQNHEVVVAEPFLLISLIAAVRRVLIVTAAFERSPTGEELNRLLFELGALGLLVLAIAVAIFMLRYSRRLRLTAAGPGEPANDAEPAAAQPARLRNGLGLTD